MKAFASLLVLLAFSMLLAGLMSLSMNASVQQAGTQQRLLQDVRLHAYDLEFKAAVGSALSSAQGLSREERARDAAEKLAVLESFLEARWRAEGADADAWAGIVSDSELRAVPGRLSSSKCRSCRDWGAWTSDADGKPARFVQGFVDVGPPQTLQGARVSRTGSSFLPELYASSFSSKRFALGATVKLQGDTAVFVLFEGFP